MKSFFARIKTLTKETLYLIKKEKAYFLAPLVIFLVLLAFLFYNVAPALITAFVYAGF